MNLRKYFGLSPIEYGIYSTTIESHDSNFEGVLSRCVVGKAETMTAIKPNEMCLPAPDTAQTEVDNSHITKSMLAVALWTFGRLDIFDNGGGSDGVAATKIVDQSWGMPWWALI